MNGSSTASVLPDCPSERVIVGGYSRVMGQLAPAGEIHGRTSKSSVPEWDRQFSLVHVYHEHREELGRLHLAGIGADVVAVAGQLGEALSGCGIGFAGGQCLSLADYVKGPAATRAATAAAA